MARYDYDLFVIGAGSGGVRAGRLAAMSGARVAVAEEDRVGGTCVIRGCIPKKFMVYASEVSTHLKSAEGYGWTLGKASFDWATFRERKDIEIARLSGVYVTNLQNAGADLIHSRATLTDAHTVALTESGKTVTAAKILIAPETDPGIFVRRQIGRVNRPERRIDAFSAGERLCRVGGMATGAIAGLHQRLAVGDGFGRGDRRLRACVTATECSAQKRNQPNRSHRAMS